MSQLFINIICLYESISYKFHSIIIVECHKNSVADDFGSFKIVTIEQQN